LSLLIVKQYADAKSSELRSDLTCLARKIKTIR